LYNKVYKSEQINVGIPVQIRPNITFQTINKMPYTSELEEDNEDSEKDMENQEDVKITSEDIIRKANEEAEAIIKEAELEAQRILEAAENEAIDRKQSIEDEVRQKGFETGYEEAKRQYEDLLSEAEFIREHANLEYNEVMAGIEKDALEIIMDVVRKVIGSEVTLNKENILILVRQALEKCSNRENITIKVSPQDYDFLVDNKERLLSMVEGIGDLDLKRDPALKSGACLIETPYGSLDAGVGTKLKKIEEAFLKLVGK